MTTTSTGVPIGHGLLADHAAEPVEFARFIHKMEYADTRSDIWRDTIPTAPAELDDTDYAQDEREDDGMGTIHGLVWAIGITGAAIAVGLLLARLI